MQKCLTNESMFKEVSGCLVEKPECGFALKFGFSYMCSHADHMKFNSRISGDMTTTEARERYNRLRLKRRAEYIASLNEESKRCFC